MCDANMVFSCGKKRPGVWTLSGGNYLKDSVYSFKVIVLPLSTVFWYLLGSLVSSVDFATEISDLR